MPAGSSRPSRIRSVAGTTAATAVAVLLPAAWVPASSPASAAPTTPLPAAVQACAKVSANNATEAELIAAFDSVKLPKSTKWAHEVVEYRPYPVEDKTFGKLKAALSKYQPPPDVLAQIVACLKLP